MISAHMHNGFRHRNPAPTMAGHSGRCVTGAIAETLSDLPAGWPLLAADGGANALLDLGRKPDMVIGDMDQLVHFRRSAAYQTQRTG